MSSLQQEQPQVTPAAASPPVLPAPRRAPEPWWRLRSTVQAGLILSTASGVALTAVAFSAARSGRPWAVVLYWVGLLLTVLPLAGRLLARSPSRGERLALVVLLGLALYVVMVLLSPDQFKLHDELGTYRSVLDVLRTHRLYTRNPVVDAYAFYPGLLSVTAALVKLSGLGVVPCGLLVIAVARILLTAGLFLFLEWIIGSSRIAGLAVVLYACNPNFFFFDSQVAYESMALGLGATVLWLTARLADGSRGVVSDLAAAAVLDAALVLSHHLTSYAVALVLLLWAGLCLIRSPRRRARPLAALALFAAAITAAYAVFAWAPTQSDIGGSITGSLHGLLDVVTGVSNGRAPFSAASGYTDPLLERVVGVGSVVLLLLALPFGLYAASRQRRIGPGLAVLALAALVYPLSLALRLTDAGAETSNRTSEFVFVGLGAVLAIAFVTLVAVRIQPWRWTGRIVRLLSLAYVGVVFAGGILVGAPSSDLLPGSYQVASDQRSIDTEGVDAARWAAANLPPHDSFFSDTSDGEIFSAYTQLVPQSGSVKGVALGQLYLAPRFGSEERNLIRYDKLRYLVVDRRDSTALPRSGGYFSASDPKASYSTPLPAAGLDKFAAVPCIDRVFASNHLVIYDTARLLEGCR